MYTYYFNGVVVTRKRRRAAKWQKAFVIWGISSIIQGVRMGAF